MNSNTSERDHLITDVTVMPMNGTAPIADGFVRVRDGRIDAIGKSDELESAERARGRSLPGHAILPGLVNSHMHFHQHREHGPIGAAHRGPIALDALRSARTALNCLREGVTTGRELGHDDGVRLTLRQATREGLIVGPRIVSAGVAIGFAFGHASFVAENISTLDELVSLIRREIQYGADFIKIIASNEDLPNPPGDELAVPWFSRKAIEVAVETAHGAGVPIAAHANGRTTLEWVIDAGVDSIEHGIYIDDDLASGMREKGIVLVPTLSGYFENSRKFWDRAWQPRYEQLWFAHRESISAAVSAGVSIATGVDTIGTIATEVEILRKFGGMDALQSLEAATIAGARLVGLDEQIGTIDVGKVADLVVVAGDPVQDSAALFDTVETYLGGARFTREELDRFVPPVDRFIDRWHLPAHRCFPER